MSKKIYDEISDEELKALTSAVNTRFGVDFTRYESKSLKRGFARLMSKHDMESLLDLWSVLLNDRDFFKKCIDDLTVNLTELFRNPEIWSVIESLILERRGSSYLDIWHAGCSTGEEVYSMSMVLHKINMQHCSRLYGTDISSLALEKARKGTYGIALLTKYQKAFKTYLGESDLGEMFEITDSHITVKSELKKICSFRHHNLVSDQVPQKYDIIFCRNVMIYFDEQLKITVLKKLIKSLKSDGFLILGYYDMLPDSARNLIVPYDAETRIYKSQPDPILENKS